MEAKRNTILVTGGASGFGLQIACHLARVGNRVIITGNCHSRLARAASIHRNIVPLYHDITNDSELSAFVTKIAADFPEINFFINNSGDDFGTSEAFEANPCPYHLADNYYSGIRITEELLPLLKIKKNAAVIDLSPITLGSIKEVSTFESIKKALVSYYDMLRYSLRKRINVTIYNLESLGLSEVSEPEWVIRKIVSIVRDTPVEEKGNDGYIQYHNSVPWAIGMA